MPAMISMLELHVHPLIITKAGANIRGVHHEQDAKPIKKELALPQKKRVGLTTTEDAMRNKNDDPKKQNDLTRKE